MGTFWLKIEQFWSFEEISIFSSGGHLGYRNYVWHFRPAIMMAATAEFNLA
jgi:hypothetical protein